LEVTGTVPDAQPYYRAPKAGLDKRMAAIFVEWVKDFSITPIVLFTAL
jgi:hypothetical protein